MEHIPVRQPMHKPPTPPKMGAVGKLRLLWIPYVLLTLGATVLVSLLHVLTMGTFPWLVLDEALQHFWLPLLASAIISIGFLIPRIRRASIGKEQMKFIFLNVLSVVLLWLPMTQSQRVVGEQFKQLTIVPAPIGEVPSAENYQFEEVHANLEARMMAPIRMRGKDEGEIVLVILTPLEAPAAGDSSLQYGNFASYREFTLAMPNNLDSAEAERRFRPWLDSLLRVEEASKRDEGLWFSSIRDRRKQSLAQQTQQINQREGWVVLEPHFEPWQKQVAPALKLWGLMGGASLLLWLLVCLVLPLKAELEERKPIKASGLGKGLAAFLWPRKGYTITPIVILLNTLFYLVCAFASRNPITFDGDVLIALGGNKPSLTQGQGEYWRLLTSAFLHGGLMHFLANMYGMVMMGRMLEPLLRAPRFLLSYLLTALVGSIASVLFLSGDAVRIGASGALFGLMGMLLALALTPLFPPQIRQPLLRTMATALGINILVSFLPNIDYTAHVGGLLCGIMLGFLWYPMLGKEKKAMIEAARQNRPPTHR
jgi:membrane associated rhomboid family serine protease